MRERERECEREREKKREIVSERERGREIGGVRKRLWFGEKLLDECQQHFASKNKSKENGESRDSKKERRSKTKKKRDSVVKAARLVLNRGTKRKGERR